MNTVKYIPRLVQLALLWGTLVCASFNANATSTRALDQREVSVMVNRLQEIKKISCSKTLAASEKTKLREEVLEIQKKLNDPFGGGVYISAGALILIIILLIILL